MPGRDADLDAYIAANQERWLEELGRLCAVPSVSARHEGVDECAALVADLIRARGFNAEVVPEPEGHPVVIARAEGRNRGRTVLLYNHYDVQPPEPLELWESPPFQLTRRGDRVFARGAKDDKGELVARLAAIDALRAVYGEHPCNLTFLVEGEEEIGSPHLPELVEANRARLQADAAIWEEGGVDGEERPLVTLGARGLLYLELHVSSLSRDGHSGGANLIPNAAWRLVWALSTLKGTDERILIPGFYDGVQPPSGRVRELLAALPSTEKEVKQSFGLDRLLLGRSGEAVVGAVFEPTCNIAGISSGYQGEGAKTIVPARASAKVDFRLVPGQDPLDVRDKLRRHLDQGGFQDVEIAVLGAERAGVVDPDEPLVALWAETAREVYGKEPITTPLMGGTTPMYLFTEHGVPVAAPGVGFGPWNLAHSPNENLRLIDFERATRHLARLLDRFAGG